MDCTGNIQSITQDFESKGILVTLSLADVSVQELQTLKAMDKLSQWTERHPGGAVFSEIKIPSYDRVISLIKRAHKDIPHFRIIGWDFAIDEVGDPVFIEYNGAPGMNQVSCGPLFGDLTEPVLDEIFLLERGYDI